MHSTKCHLQNEIYTISYAKWNLWNVSCKLQSKNAIYKMQLPKCNPKISICKINLQNSIRKNQKEESPFVSGGKCFVEIRRKTKFLPIENLGWVQKSNPKRNKK